ncbi:hypothetical protein FJZ40_01280 [Candidatus Shapirobacteria bacterium]|nr:hypothetical protein [Candidatus Shapirobacteria bacterium]
MAIQAETTEVEVFIDRFPERSGITENLLAPRNEIDNAGFKRRIYNYKGYSFSFRGKEELPEFGTVNKSKVVLLGSDPVHVSSDSYQSYRDKIIKTDESAEDLPTLYLATKDIQGVISLALELGATDPHLIRILEEVKSGIYSGRALDLMDKLMAVNCVTDNEKEWSQKLASGDAEAIVALSILGSEEAGNYINSKLEQMRDLDALREITEEKGKPMDIEKQVCVHATKFKPNVVENGYEVKTTGDATNWEYVRNTVHVSLNHKVVSHMMGKWDTAPYVLISPMKDVVQESGLPESDQEWDTWWVLNPGETLKFPNSILVEPGKMPFNTLYVIGEKTSTFKGEGYTMDDLLNTEKVTGSNIDLLSSFKSILFPNYSEDENLKAFIDSNWDVEKISQLLIEKYFPNERYPEERKGKSFLEIIRYHVSSWNDTELFDQKIKVSENILIADRVTEILNDLGISQAFKGKAEDFEQMLQTLSEYISKDIEGDIFSNLSSLVVSQTVEKMGYKATGGGNWPSAHNGSSYDWLTKGHFVAVDNAKKLGGTDDDSTEIRGEFDWRKFDPTWYVLPEVNAKTRRVIYASGAFNSREE